MKDGVEFGQGEHYVHNNIFYGATTDCALVDGGALTTYKNNIVGNNSCGDGVDNQINVDPLLPANPTRPTGQTAGYLWHFPLPANSPAVDAAGRIGGTELFVTLDQINTRRPQPEGGENDIGAVELKQTTPPPVASFIVTGTSGDLLRYFNASGSSGLITSYAWDFGDGNSGSGESTSHSYASADSYVVTLTVTGPGGSDSTTQTTTAGTADTTPFASFTVRVNRYEATFTSTSVGSNLNFSWDVNGDNVEDYYTQNPTHTYPSNPATYTVTLTVSNGAGSNSVFQQITVSGAPTVNRSTTGNQPTGGDSGGGGGGGGDGSDGEDEPDDQAAPLRVQRLTCVSIASSIEILNSHPSTQCQQVSGAGIGNDAILAANPKDAVDVWGYIPPNLKVCFRMSSGSFRFLDAAYAPRMISSLPAFGEMGMICTTIDRPGTVVLLPGPMLPVPTAVPVRGQGLWNCTVTTNFLLNLRDAPAGADIGDVPWKATMRALERTVGWFKVDYEGKVGWLAAMYLDTQGNCD